MSIAIAIPTFRRAEMLAALLTSVAGLDTTGTAEPIEVIVFDNDPDGSAEPVVAAARAGYPFALHYEHVADRGLSAVRNRTLEVARARYRLVAMIDDDEVPEPQWLAELVRVQRTSGADAVVGPVPSILPDDAPRWIRDFRALELPDHADGTLLHDGWSGNCLLDLTSAATRDLSFDRTLDFAGGEDQLFFRQLLAAGGRIAYAARATAWEHTPSARRSVRFVLLRSFRRGNTLSFCDRRLAGTPAVLALRALKGVGLIVLGTLKLAPLALRRGSAACVGCAADAATGAGMLAGLAGFTYQAYRPKR